MSRGRIITLPKRGEVYLIKFDPTIGAEIRKTRPGLIIQNDLSNQSSPVTIVATISSKFTLPLHPTEVLINSTEGGLTRDSVVLCNQIRTVDKQRLTKRIGKIQSTLMGEVDSALSISLGLRYLS